MHRTIYDADQQEFRRKAKHVQTEMDDGIDYEVGQITVMEQLKGYVALKQGVRYNIRVGYRFVLSLMAKGEFGYRRINTIRGSDKKLWFRKLHMECRGYRPHHHRPGRGKACVPDGLR